MTTQTQLYMLVPISADQAAPASLPQGAVLVQLATPIKPTATQGPIAVTPVEPSQPTSAKQGKKWTDPNPTLPTQTNTLPAQTILVQPVQVVAQPVQTVLVQPVQVVAKQPAQPVVMQPVQAVKQSEQKVVVQAYENAEQTVAVPMPPATSVFVLRRDLTMEKRWWSLVEMGILLLIWILCIVSLAIPSWWVDPAMHPGDAVSEAFGIPSIILVFCIIIRITVLQCISKVYYQGQIVKISLWVAAGLWITGTVGHIVALIIISAEKKKSMGNAGIGIGIAVIPFHIGSAIFGVRAIDRLINLR